MQRTDGMHRMDFETLVQTRKSVRGFKKEPVSRAVIGEIIEVAKRAPSSMNTQPWHIHVLTGEPLEEVRRRNMEEMIAGAKPKRDIVSHGEYQGVHRGRQVDIAKKLFAAMGIAVPGALAAKLAYPDRKVIAVTGDAGFMMNSQEIETGLRMKTPFVILIWNDSEYGLITWHQLRHFGRPSHISFKNPDFVKYAESFGAKGYRVERTEDLVPTLKRAFADETVVIVDCPVDYSENMKLTERLKNLTSPLA